MNKIDDAIEMLEKLKYYDLEDIEAIMTDTNQDFDYHSYLSEYGFVSDEEASAMLEYECTSGSIDRVACFLANVDRINQTYYYVNGYGNLENVRHTILECFRDDLIRRLEEER